MKVIVVGATGAIGSRIMQQVLRRNEITQVIALTRRALPNNINTNDENDIANHKLKNIIISDFAALSNVPVSTWNALHNADALIWAMGTYDLNEAVNLTYPLAFQEEFAKHLSRRQQQDKFRFILLGGAFVEPDQARRLYFLPDQRHMKGMLQTKTLEFADERNEDWEAIIVRPGGLLFGGDTYLNCAAEWLFGRGLVIRGEELGACVADLVVNGSGEKVIENADLVERGRRLLSENL